MERLQNELDKSHSNLDRAEKEKHELESQILCLRQNLDKLEEAHAQAVQEREEQIQKMEQVLEEELEQFENLLKSKDVEVRDDVRVIYFNLFLVNKLV